MLSISKLAYSRTTGPISTKLSTKAALRKWVFFQVKVHSPDPSGYTMFGTKHPSVKETQIFNVRAKQFLNVRLTIVPLWYHYGTIIALHKCVLLVQQYS